MDNYIITIGFSRTLSPKVFGALIRLVDGTPYSHTYVRLDLPPLGDMVFQASGLSVNMLSYASFVTNNTIVEEFKIPINAEDYINLIEFVRKSLGRPYSAKQLFHIGWLRLASRMGIKAKMKNLNGDSVYICSELAMRALKTVGVFEDAEYADALSPRDIFKLIEKLEKPLVLI